jgi:hypothetical protein
VHPLYHNSVQIHAHDRETAIDTPMACGKYWRMKRDMDLIRHILLRKEAEEEIEGDQEAIVYHIALLKDAGFVDAEIIEGGSGFPVGAAILRLTWQGHEFLDASRDNKVWHAVKEKALKPGMSWTISTLFELLKQEAARQFGLS